MWGIVWPFLLAAWMFLFAGFMSFFFGRKDVGADQIFWRGVQRGLRWVLYLSVGFGGLILVASFPSWYYWGQLHIRGVPVNAKVLSRSLEYEESGQFTRITYEFEAEVDGQRRPFQREATLRGWQFMGCADVQVLHDPNDPSDSRMTLEFTDALQFLLSPASFLVLGVGSFLLSRRLSDAGAAVSVREKDPPVDGTAVPGRRV